MRSVGCFVETTSIANARDALLLPAAKTKTLLDFSIGTPWLSDLFL
jgi:hypothetical protein